MKKKVAMLLLVFSVFTISSASAATPDRDPICIKVPGGQDMCEW
ncbi:hypothetical protein J6TS2_52050 [Heyndrickxia sporothermodurans]|nr:hypothetical protein J6TS2_52050 [Heyndrickxia sporothermodurans]